MPTRQEFDHALKSIAEYIAMIDDEIDDEVSGETDNNGSLEGYQCSHGTHDFLVIGSPIWEYFTVRYPYDVATDLAVSKAVENTPQGQQDVEITDQMVESAQQELANELAQHGDEELAQIRFNAIQLFASSDCAVDLHGPTRDQVHGFDLDKKVFVYEDGSSVSDFEQAVQSVVNLGWLGKEYLLNTYGISHSGGVSDTSGTSGFEPEGPRGFQ